MTAGKGGEKAVPKKKGRGRKSGVENVDLSQVEVIASLGHTDEEIAVLLHVKPRTINYWKKNKEFLQSLKRGKLKADFQVTKSLYNKATGRRVVVTKDARGIAHEETIYVEPDTTAAIFWLKNRRPDLWRDSKDVNHSGEIRTGLSMAQLKRSIKELRRAGGD